MFAYGETVVRLRGIPKLDPYSQEVTALDWSTPDELDIDGVGVEPRPSTEPNETWRNAVVIGFTLYCPSGSDITSADRVRVRGEVFDVEGDVADWRNPFSGWAPGMVVQLKRVGG